MLYIHKQSCCIRGRFTKLYERTVFADGPRRLGSKNGEYEEEFQSGGEVDMESTKLGKYA